MNTPLKTIEHKNFDINIYQDNDYDTPDSWGNIDVFIVYDHRQFNVEADGFDCEEIAEFFFNNKGKGLYNNEYWVLPLYAYIHSGVALSLGKTQYPFTCQFDTSFKGFVLVKRMKGWSYTKTKAIEIAKSEINLWNDCLSGNVYGYTIVHKDTEEEIGSCWGFYGDYDTNGMIDECKGIIDSEINRNPVKYAMQLELEIG
jgi:hypothetical protein